MENVKDNYGSTALHDWSEIYARNNWATFPLQPNEKKPMGGSSGWRDASVDAEKRRQFFRGKSLKDCNIGIATGLVSRLVVLDYDPSPERSARDIRKEFEKKIGQTLPQTYTALTPSGGEHEYYFCEVELPCRVGVVEGLDIRGDGGYVVAHPSMFDGRQYYIEENVSGDLAHIPQAAIDLLTSLAISKTPTYKRLSSDFEIPDGQRDVTLTSIVGHLLAKHVDEGVAQMCAHGVNWTFCRPPLPDSQVEKIIGSVATREMKKRLERGAQWK